MRITPSLVAALSALTLIAAVTGVGAALTDRLEAASIALLYLLPVMLVSARWGLMAGLGTGAVSALAFNFFLLPPRYTLRIADPDNLVTMLVLFAVAAATSQLTDRLRRAIHQANLTAADNIEIAGFTRIVAAMADPVAVERHLADTFAGLTSAGVMIAPDEDGMNGLDRAAARWALAHGGITGRGTEVMAGADHLFVPVAGGSLLALSAPVPVARRPLIEALAVQAGHAIERIRLAAERQEIDRHHEREALRTALLSSVGHDLRSPLTTIIGEVETGAPEAMPRIAVEARRLERLIDNLLGMARIEAGEIRLAIEPIDLIDAVQAALQDVRDVTADIALPADLPFVRADPQFLHHMLVNLLDNARKHGSGAVSIIGRAVDGGVQLDIADDGPGLPPGSETAVFERFARLAGSDRIPGSGLGLAIVRGFGSAMGIGTSAGNRAGGHGAVFTLSFPR
jgi:two-component system sensor histidine kinase KdpD